MGQALILTAVVLTLLALFVRRREAALHARGVVASATVVRADENHDAAVVIGGVVMPAPTYEITVGFADSRGRAHTTTFTTPRKMHAAGDTVRVIYQQEKPMLAKLLPSDNDVPDRTSTFLFALAALAFVLTVASGILR
jgi:predicted phage tail protein